MKTTDLIEYAGVVAETSPEVLGGVIILLTPEQNAEMFSTLPEEITLAILDHTRDALSAKLADA